MTTPPTRLNVDVLAIVCEFLSDVPDVRSLALTCSSLQRVAVAWLLRMSPIYLTQGTSLRRFHSFLFSDVPARAPHVRAVHVDLRLPGPPQTQADDFAFLLGILHTCKHIEHLTIAFEPPSHLLAEDPLARVVQAIAAMIPSLRSFSILSSSTNALSHIPHISAPLRTLGIHCRYISASCWSPAALENFIPCVAETLENLEIANLTVEPLMAQDGSHPPRLSTVDPKNYPAVRSLSVFSLKGRPLLEHLQHLFPALDGTLSFGELDTRCREEEYDQIRDVNQRAQERNADGSPSSGAWKKLDRIVCCAPMFYVLGLRCPIRHVMIDLDWGREHGRYVALALRENPVPRLKLTSEHDLRTLAEILSPELAETLTHLTLCLLCTDGIRVEADGTSSQLRWEDVLVSAQASDRAQMHMMIVCANCYCCVLGYRTGSSPPFGHCIGSRTSASSSASACTSTVIVTRTRRRHHRSRPRTRKSTTRIRSATRRLTSRGRRPCSRGLSRRRSTSSSRRGASSRARPSWRVVMLRRRCMSVGTRAVDGVSRALGLGLGLGLGQVSGFWTDSVREGSLSCMTQSWRLSSGRRSLCARSRTR